MYKSLVHVSRLRPLPKADVPPPFQLAPDSYTLEQLLEQHFWAQAVHRTSDLLAEYSTRETITIDTVPEILQLWHSRFYALLKLKLGSQVNDETLNCLEALDLPEVKELSCPVVWDLRLMLIPVRAKGINQNAIQQLYVMASEARTHLGEENDAVWKDRLRKLGLHVAAALIGMRDPATAIDHLETLYAGEKAIDPTFAESLAKTLALIHIQMGNIPEARRWTRDSFAGEIEALESLSSGSSIPKDTQGVNASLIRSMDALHRGQIETARELLQQHLPDLSLSGLYNLFVLYDLSPSKAAEDKAKAAETLVGAGRLSLGTYELFA